MKKVSSECSPSPTVCCIKKNPRKEILISTDWVGSNKNFLFSFPFTIWSTENLYHNVFLFIKCKVFYQKAELIIDINIFHWRIVVSVLIRCWEWSVWTLRQFHFILKHPVFFLINNSEINHLIIPTVFQGLHFYVSHLVKFHRRKKKCLGKASWLRIFCVKYSYEIILKLNSLVKQVSLGAIII